MDPWTLIGWVLFGLLAIALLGCLAFFGFILYGLILFIRDEKLKSKKAKEAVEEGIVDFDAFNAGDYLTIAGRKWKVREIETSFDIDYNQDKVLIILQSDRADLLYGH